jgi:hypothetical protein
MRDEIVRISDIEGEQAVAQHGLTDDSEGWRYFLLFGPF